MRRGPGIVPGSARATVPVLQRNIPRFALHAALRPGHRRESHYALESGATRLQRLRQRARRAAKRRHNPWACHPQTCENAAPHVRCVAVTRVAHKIRPFHQSRLWVGETALMHILLQLYPAAVLIFGLQLGGVCGYGQSLSRCVVDVDDRGDADNGRRQIP